MKLRLWVRLTVSRVQGRRNREKGRWHERFDPQWKLGQLGKKKEKPEDNQTGFTGEKTQGVESKCM